MNCLTALSTLHLRPVNYLAPELDRFAFVELLELAMRHALIDPLVGAVRHFDSSPQPEKNPATYVSWDDDHRARHAFHYG